MRPYARPLISPNRAAEHELVVSELSEAAHRAGAVRRPADALPAVPGHVHRAGAAGPAAPARLRPSARPLVRDRRPAPAVRAAADLHRGPPQLPGRADAGRLSTQIHGLVQPPGAPVRRPRRPVPRLRADVLRLDR